jgi:hypothetical protein
VRYPLSTSGGLLAGAVAVCRVDGLVIAHAEAQGVPEDFEPAVAELAQRGVVAVAADSLGVVELTGPGRAGQAAERPLLDGLAEVAVISQAAGDSELAAPGAPGDRGAPGIALQRVRRGELLEVLADLAGDRAARRSPGPGMLR